MQKFMRTPDDVVPDYLRGLIAAHPRLIRYDEANRIVLRAAAPPTGKVAVISGGGSGCEPMHTGFVGPGMLDAACPGPVFSSPVPSQITAATVAADQGAGVLYVIPNFGGEVMNFGLAAEILSRQGHRIERVVVDDDVALDGEQRHRRRGLGATVIVEKIAGAAAEAGLALEQVTALARRTVSQARTFGVSLSSCIHPSTGTQTFALSPAQMEVGVGIGGDRGIARSALPLADEVAELLVQRTVEELDLVEESRLIVLLSGLGGTPEIELMGLFGHVHAALASRGATIERSLVGNYVTSLESAGALLTVLRTDAELTGWWDAPVHTSALRWEAAE